MFLLAKLFLETEITQLALGFRLALVVPSRINAPVDLPAGTVSTVQRLVHRSVCAIRFRPSPSRNETYQGPEY
ncbi:MAG: hypothetical protein A2378_01105 [Candidatus Pacebacteria bacterium RIFOXYB1_FULL_44_10]|nr:MAG: hypothetical protein A2378_01105 [Candidatus Pacebacteria bacterium RIFOXYB1_FULL_44_10]HAX01632.1 hypothetical protein [Candidatus Paceibacterota bacterium]